MTEKELKRLRRADLLELLLQQSRENQELKQQLEDAQAQLEDRRLRIERAGSLAEASLQLSGVFEAAQDACARYIENIKAKNQEADEYKDALANAIQTRCGPCPKWKEFVDSRNTKTGMTE